MLFKEFHRHFLKSSGVIQNRVNMNACLSKEDYPRRPIATGGHSPPYDNRENG